MKVNNITFDEHKMKVYSFEYQPLSMPAIVFQADNGLGITHGGYNVKPKQMSLICQFRDKLDISKFIQALIEKTPTIIDIDDGFIYECYYLGQSTSDEFWNGWYKVEFIFNVIQLSRSIKKINLISQSNNIYNKGTYKCPLIIEILPKVDITTLIIGEYTITNLKANKKFTIDGVKKTVMCDGQNRFEDVEFKNNSFPFLETRKNSIILSQLDNIEVTLKFREVYI